MFIKGENHAVCVYYTAKTQTGEKMYGTCHRMFAGNECYANHCRPNREGQSVCQKFYKCVKCNKVMSHQKRKPEDHMCEEKMCWNCEEFVDPNKHRCYMKPIVNQEEDTGGAHSKRNKNKKRKRKPRRVSEEVISHEVEEEEEEEDTDEEEGQEYLFFDIESHQDDGRHIANFSLYKMKRGLRWCLKVMTVLINSVRGC